MIRRLGRWLARHDIAALRAEIDHLQDGLEYERGLRERVERERDDALTNTPWQTAANYQRRALAAEAANRRYDQILAEQRANDPEHRAVVGSAAGAEAP